MNRLKDYVNWKLTHADKPAEVEGYPLVLENCKANKRMKQLEIYGNSVQDGTPTPDNPIEVESVGVKSVNLFDVNTVTVIKSFNAKNIIATDSGFSFIANGTYANATLKIGLPIDYIGKTLTLSSPSYYNTSATQLLLFDGTTVHRTGSNYVSNNNGLYSTTITINESDCIDGYFLCIRLYFTGQTTGNIIEYKNIMLAEGSTTTPYEPYGKYKIPVVVKTDTDTITTNIFLNEPLRKIGDYADYVDFKNKCVVRRNKEIVLKGSDITYRYTAYGDTRGFYIYGNATKYNDAYIDGFYTWDNYKQPEKSTHFIANQSRGSAGQNAGDWYINSNYNLRFHLAPEAFSSDGVSSALADIKAWVQSQYDAGTPFKFIYRLVHPIEETITCELPKLNAKTTIIEVNTSLLPGNMYGKYIKR